MPEQEHDGSGFNGIIGMIIGMTEGSLVQENLHAHCPGVFSMHKAVG